MHLTIAYFTSRKRPMIQWFLDSLERETGGDYSGIRLVVVDRWFGEPFRMAEIANYGRRPDPMNPAFETFSAPKDVVFTNPKPCVWQGDHRLTKEDWFAASNARNTAVCLAPDGWLAYVDDLSVLLPGWLKQVRMAMAGDQKTITLGAYRKVKDLVVENGNIVSFTEFDGGVDNRYAHGFDDKPLPCEGNWLYGCSLVGPVQAWLDINGWPEAWCDGLSFEDCICGIMLAKKGYKFQYVRSMMTYESDELHAQLPVMKRSDYGVSPNDKSHAVLAAARAGDGWHPNYFGEEGIAGLRKRVLAGEPFPIMHIPEHEWFTGTPLKDL